MTQQEPEELEGFEKEVEDAMREATKNSDQKAQEQAWHQRSIDRTRRLYNAALSVWIYEQALVSAGYSGRAAHDMAMLTQGYFLEEEGLE